MNRTTNTIIGITSIAIGGMIYMLWRKQTLLMFSWFNNMGMRDAVEAMRRAASGYYPLIPQWVCFSLPTALWLFGGILLFWSIWENDFYERYFWVAIFSFIAVGAELGQLIGFIPGTYDPKDVILMVLSIVLAIVLNKKQKPKEIENAKNI
jgi:hypothetical protein